MERLVLLVLLCLIVSCLAAPGERVRRHGYDYGHGGYGGGGGGYGGGGYGGGGYGDHGLHGGHGYSGGHIPISQSYSKASASASSSGGSIVG